MKIENMISHGHEPNAESQQALKEASQEEGDIFDTVDDFWESMGISSNSRQKEKAQ